MNNTQIIRMSWLWLRMISRCTSLLSRAPRFLVPKAESKENPARWYACRVFLLCSSSRPSNVVHRIHDRTSVVSNHTVWSMIDWEFESAELQKMACTRKAHTKLRWVSATYGRRVWKYRSTLEIYQKEDCFEVWNQGLVPRAHGRSLCYVRTKTCQR